MRTAVSSFQLPVASWLLEMTSLQSAGALLWKLETGNRKLASEEGATA
jgi:hypothetical protein